MDGGVGAVIGGFEPAVWTVLRVRPVMEAAVGEGAAQALVEEEEWRSAMPTVSIHLQSMEQGPTFRSEIACKLSQTRRVSTILGYPTHLLAPPS